MARVPTIAVNIEVAIPIPVVIANPLMAPVPTAYRMIHFDKRRHVGVEDRAERAAITFVNRLLNGTPVAQLFFDTLVDQNVSIDRHRKG
ncbi:Uncharacterised protein [Klebsiella variicola]|uniref:Uncharacterized protein n=1 Tax=Klebsiella variicola TaxID=244366 RepID=A0A7H4MEF8_KLEVA|nr:Uncharacterised protein [Klebsiella variicola]